MSMTYLQIVDAVLKNGLEGMRADAQQWVQFRHAWLWDIEDWTFKYDTATVTFTAGSQTVADAPADLHAVIALYDTDGSPVQGIPDVWQFFDIFNANLADGNSRPYAYTVVGSTLMIGPPGDGTDGLLIYEKTKPTLADDADPTGLPDGYDLALVHGGKAEGFKLNNIDLADQFDADFTAAVNVLRRSYLSKVRQTGDQIRPYRP